MEHTKFLFHLKSSKEFERSRRKAEQFMGKQNDTDKIRTGMGPYRSRP